MQPSYSLHYYNLPYSYLLPTTQNRQNYYYAYFSQTNTYLRAPNISKMYASLSTYHTTSHRTSCLLVIYHSKTSELLLCILFPNYHSTTFPRTLKRLNYYQTSLLSYYTFQLPTNIINHTIFYRQPASQPSHLPLWTWKETSNYVLPLSCLELKTIEKPTLCSFYTTPFSHVTNNTWKYMIKVQ